MTKNYLLESYEDKLQSVLWENMKILTLAERQLQGIDFIFGPAKDQTEHTTT